ncbi:MAG: hypothetical protein ORN21_02825 [Methylophilaceae bacterium]|nr:hypothetical protein [Methylophilaceae bacterium]
MQCKAAATQEARPINKIGEPLSSTQRRNSPVQTVWQRSLIITCMHKVTEPLKEFYA